MYKKLAAYCKEKDIDLVAVTKTRAVSSIEELYEMGHRDFGENRVQELQDKHDEMPKDIRWHMIGHLQSNKVKYIAPFVYLIHSGAGLSLLKEINKRARQHNRVIDVLLQIKIGQEAAKTGWEKEELFESLNNGAIQDLKHTRVKGVMGMATFTTDQDTIHSEFSELRSLFDLIQQKYYQSSPHFNTVSMGMSGDYKIAAECGSTMVRIGSLLFS